MKRIGIMVFLISLLVYFFALWWAWVSGSMWATWNTMVLYTVVLGVGLGCFVLGVAAVFRIKVQPLVLMNINLKNRLAEYEEG